MKKSNVLSNISSCSFGFNQPYGKRVCSSDDAKRNKTDDAKHKVTHRHQHKAY